MAIEVKKYTLEEFDKWNLFIANSINGNFLHSRHFYDSNALNEADDSSLMFFKKNKIIAVLPAMLQQQDQSLILNSHLRATYGGVIINTSVGVSEAIEIIGLIIQYGRNLSVTEIIVRNPFRILYKQLSDEVDYALWYHDFSIQSRELEIYVDLKKDVTEIRQSYENGAKYNI